MTDQSCQTLGEVRDRLEELIDEHGEDREVFTNNHGTVMPGVRVNDQGRRTVFF